MMLFLTLLFLLFWLSPSIQTVVYMRLFLRFTNVLLTHSSPSQSFINTILLYSPAPLPFPLITAALLGEAFEGLIGRI